MANIRNRLTISVAQLEIELFNKERNVDKIEKMAELAKNEFAPDLVMFPECASTGYCFSSREEVASMAEPLTGPTVTRMREFAARREMFILFGMIEKHDECLFNTACLCMPDGNIHPHRKTHLPAMCVDKHVNRGDEFSVVDTGFGKFGITICYEMRFPEVARVLTLRGVRIIFDPVSLPRGGEAHPNFLTRARAAENRVYVVTCNRIGVERGFRFIGRSQVIDPSGRVLCEMGENEGLICSTIDLSGVEKEDNAFALVEQYETHFFDDRRPDFYKSIVSTPLTKDPGSVTETLA